MPTVSSSSVDVLPPTRRGAVARPEGEARTGAASWFVPRACIAPSASVPHAKRRRTPSFCRDGAAARRTCKEGSATSAAERTDRVERTLVPLNSKIDPAVRTRMSFGVGRSGAALAFARRRVLHQRRACGRSSRRPPRRRRVGGDRVRLSAAGERCSTTSTHGRSRRRTRASSRRSSRRSDRRAAAAAASSTNARDAVNERPSDASTRGGTCSHEQSAGRGTGSAPHPASNTRTSSPPPASAQRPCR